jgi:hypothetical protein
MCTRILGSTTIEEGQAEVADDRQAFAEHGHLPQPAQGGGLELPGEQSRQQIARETGGEEHAGIHQRTAPGLQRAQNQGGANQHEQDGEGSLGAEEGQGHGGRPRSAGAVSCSVAVDGMRPPE